MQTMQKVINPPTNFPEIVEFNNKKLGYYPVLEEDLFYEFYNNIHEFNFLVSKDLFDMC